MRMYWCVRSYTECGQGLLYAYSFTGCVRTEEVACEILERQYNHGNCGERFKSGVGCSDMESVLRS